MWNQTVDRALISGVAERQILEVKQGEIEQKVKASIQKSGRNPALLKSIIMTAIYALELLIGKVFKMASQKADKSIETVEKAEKLLNAEIECYDLYMRGECYGFRLYEDGEETDSCWGFLGDVDELNEEIASHLPDECKDLVDKLEFTWETKDQYLRKRHIA